MSKPIFLVGLPDDFFGQMKDIDENLQMQLTDYHVVVYSNNKEVITFKALYEKDFDEVKFKELKEIVRGSFKRHSNDHPPKH